MADLSGLNGIIAPELVTALENLAAGPEGSSEIADGAIIASKIATGACTPAKVASLLHKYFGLGNNGAGHVTLAAAKIGDIVQMAINLTDLTDATALFEAAVTVNGQIQQVSTDLSAKKLLIILQAQS